MAVSEVKFSQKSGKFSLVQFQIPCLIGRQMSDDAYETQYTLLIASVPRYSLEYEVFP